MMSTREQILETTCELMESQGYHATGLNQIVQVSGAPKGSLYHYFPEGKEQIASEAIAHVAGRITERIRTNLAAIADPAEALQAFCEQVAENVERSGFRAGGPLTSVAAETATTSERLNQACRAAYAGMRQAFEEKLLTGGISQEQAGALAGFVLAAMEGAILLSRTAHSGDPLRQAGATLALTLRAVRSNEE